MVGTIFSNIYDKLTIPVIACRRDDGLSVAYLNAAAMLLVAPGRSLEQINGNHRSELLVNVLRFQSREKFQIFRLALENAGAVDDMDADILSFQGDVMPVRLDANAAIVAGEEFFIIYLGEAPAYRPDEAAARFVNRILNASHHITDVDLAIQSILQLAGDYAKVSRAYIFEEDKARVTGVTYEWCAEGVSSARDALQNLDKNNYNHSIIMQSAGMMIARDISLLPENDRRILEEQGIRAVAFLPLFHYDKPLGFIGFDDCWKTRDWTVEETQLLRNVASVVASLINRRNAERESLRRRDIFRTVIDNLDELVYISDLDTDEIMFVSKSMAAAMRRPPKELIGKPCWQVVREESEHCLSCPIPAMRRGVAGGRGGVAYISEMHSPTTGKWYMVKDSIIEWIDGRPVHLGTMVDITYRKQYEEQLKRFAATDAMTDVYNRKWGYGKLEGLYRLDEAVRARQTLCFIDIDGLKSVNDRFGHAMGDDLIVNTIRTIFSCIRKDDFISRWGGDEFILFLNCGVDDAMVVMQKIAFGIEHFNTTGGKPYTLSISYGMVGFAEPFPTLDALIDEADRRMYANKTRNRESPAAVRGM